MSERLCLKWDDFQDNAISAFQSLRSDTEFTDVTLACKDGQQIGAHKVILAASSPFFESLLRMNKHSHPLIFMKGTKSEDLVAIIDFIYYGEVHVYQENIDSLLVLAEELNVKGLTRNEEKENILNPEPKRRKIKPATNPKTEKLVVNDEEPDSYDPHTTATTNTNKTVSLQNHSMTSVYITDIQDLDEQVKTMMTKSQSTYQNGKQKNSICTVCGKEGLGTAIRDHIEAKHLEGVSIPCNFCEKTFRTRHALRTHKIMWHK